MSEDFVAWARAKNASYSRRRSVYRRSHPERAVQLDERAVYVAPVELRPKLPGDADG